MCQICNYHFLNSSLSAGLCPLITSCARVSCKDSIFEKDAISKFRNSFFGCRDVSCVLGFHFFKRVWRQLKLMVLIFGSAAGTLKFLFNRELSSFQKQY